MRYSGLAALILAFAVFGSACAYNTFQTDLDQVAYEAGLMNVTTGDGEFSDYTATGYYEAYEWGLSFGVPVGISHLLGVPHPIKGWEIFPAKSNEELLGEVAKMAKADEAKALINVEPHYDFYSCFPLGFIGMYMDRASGTGIRVR